MLEKVEAFLQKHEKSITIIKRLLGVVLKVAFVIGYLLFSVVFKLAKRA